MRGLEGYFLHPRFDQKNGARFEKARDILTGKGILQLLAKIQASGCICLSVCWEFGKSYAWATELMRIKQMCAFFSIVVVVFGKKRGIRKSDEKNSGKRDFREENAGNTGSDL